MASDFDVRVGDVYLGVANACAELGLEPEVRARVALDHGVHVVVVLPTVEVLDGNVAAEDDVLVAFSADDAGKVVVNVCAVGYALVD